MTDRERLQAAIEWTLKQYGTGTDRTHVLWALQALAVELNMTKEAEYLDFCLRDEKGQP